MGLNEMVVLETDFGGHDNISGNDMKFMAIVNEDVYQKLFSEANEG